MKLLDCQLGTPGHKLHTVEFRRVLVGVLIFLAATFTACGGGSSDQANQAGPETGPNVLANQGFEFGASPWEVCGSARLLSGESDAAEGSSYVRLDGSIECDLIRYSERLLLYVPVAARLRQPIELSEVPSELHLSLSIRLSDQVNVFPEFGFRLVTNDGVIGEDWHGASFSIRPITGDLSPGNWSRVSMTFINDEFLPELVAGDIPRWFEVIVLRPGSVDIDRSQVYIDVDDIYLSKPVQ